MRSFVVFFDWDKDNITPEAAQTLNTVGQYYNKTCSGHRILLSGHADHTGIPIYNVDLSERRNAQVSLYLSSHGLQQGNLAYEAHGETQLKIPTRKGVREIQNRRVEIYIQ